MEEISFKMTGSDDIEILKKMEKGEIMNFIREKLSFKEIFEHLRHVDDESKFKTEHRRFNMSGYDHTIKGICTLLNLGILNEFAYLGIYDYTSYLFLDFYKGNATLYLQYWNEDENLKIDFDCYGTTEIIYEIFKYTFLSDKKERRRN